MEKTFKKRLEKLRNSLAKAGMPVSKNKFAGYCGIKSTTMLGYLSGQSEPNLANLVKIAAACNVRVGWLAAGEEPKELQRPILDDTETLDFLEAVAEGKFEDIADVVAAAQDTKNKLTLIKGHQNRKNVVDVASIYKRKIDKLDKETRELFHRILTLKETNFLDGYCRVASLVSEIAEKLTTENLKKTSQG